MKLKLTVWQRMKLIFMLSGLHGDVGLVRKASKALDVLEFSDEERKRLNVRSIADNVLQWDDSDEVFELEIKDREAVSLIRQIAENYQDWPAANRKEVLDLVTQLGLKEKREEDK